MPLLIGSSHLQHAPESVGEFLKNYPHFQDVASNLREKNFESVSSEKLLYIYQREYAVLGPNDENLDFIGSEDATTCHIFVLRHSGSGVTALGHCDGVKTSTFVVSMVTDVLKLSVGGPEGRLEAHIVGGFIDPKQESIKLTKQLLEALQNCDEEVHLMTACFTDMNDVLRDGVHFPVILGLCVEVKTGQIFPATFPDKGPDANIRGALAFAGYKKVHNVYDSERRQLVVGPYNWEPMPYLTYYLEKSDEFLRQNLSTSPEQEPEGFSGHVRLALTTLLEHPYPLVTLFPNQQPRRYHMSTPGEWSRVGEINLGSGDANTEHDRTHRGGDS